MDKKEYIRISNEIHNLILKITNKVEFIATDEGYIDLTGIVKPENKKQFALKFKERIKELQKDGYRLISTTLNENSKFLEEFNFEGKNIVVMGNEANGISAEMLKISNNHLKIDMDNSMESLNVSIAAAIIMYKIFKG